MVSQTDGQIEGDPGFHAKQESRPKGRRGGLFRLFRAFSGKKSSYDQLDSGSDSQRPTDVIGGYESNVDNLNKKDGFLRRSFRRSKRKMRNARPTSMVDFRTLENRYSGSNISISSVGVAGRDRVPSDGGDKFVQIEPLPNISRSGVSVTRTLETEPTDKNDEAGDHEFPGDKTQTSDETVNATGDIRDYNGDPTQIQLEEIRAYSDISDRLQVAETNIERRDMKARVTNAPDNQTLGTKTSGVTKLSRRVSFKKGIVTKYSDLDTPDPVEVAKNYTPYPDLSQYRQDDVVGTLGTGTSSSTIKDTLSWTKEKLSNVTSKIQTVGTHFDRHDISAAAKKISLSKLNRRVSFNAKSVVSSYSDLEAGNGINDDVFIESNDSAISEHDDDLRTAYEISTGVSEMNLGEFSKRGNKYNDYWFSQGGQNRGNDAHQIHRFKSNDTHETDNTDNESMMSISSTLTSSSTASKSAARRTSSSSKTHVRTYNHLNDPDITTATDLYELREEIPGHVGTSTDKSQNLPHSLDESRDDLIVFNSPAGGNIDPIRFENKSDIARYTQSKATIMSMYGDSSHVNANVSQLRGLGSNSAIPVHTKQERGEIFENLHSTQGQTLEPVHHELDIATNRPHQPLPERGQTQRENRGNVPDSAAENTIEQSNPRISGYVGLKSWSDALENTNDETVSEYELRENLGEFGRGEPKRQSKFRKILKRRGSKNEKYPKGERF